MKVLTPHFSSKMSDLAHCVGQCIYNMPKKDLNFNVIRASKTCLACLAKLDHIKSYRVLGFCDVPIPKDAMINFP